MNYPVTVKGLDINSAIMLPTTTLTVAGDPARSDAHRIQLCEIDALDTPVTYRKIRVEKSSPLTLTMIEFNIKIQNMSMRKGISNVIPVATYPQKHTIDVEIIGANGANGFLPGGYMLGNVSQATAIAADNKLPTTLASLFSIYGRNDERYASGDNPLGYFEASNLLRGWSICEHEWWSYISANSDADFDPSETAQLYARPCDQMALLSKIAGGATITRAHLNLYKWLNLMYSDQNQFTIRATLEIFSPRDKLVTFERFVKGTIIQS